MKPNEQHDDRVRLDKWLWAARFFKHRSLATEAVDGGKVQLNNIRVKPAKDVKIGDRVGYECREMGPRDRRNVRAGPRRVVTSPRSRHRRASTVSRLRPLVNPGQSRRNQTATDRRTSANSNRGRLPTLRKP